MVLASALTATGNEKCWCSFAAYTGLGRPRGCSECSQGQIMFTMPLRDQRCSHFCCRLMCTCIWIYVLTRSYDSVVHVEYLCCSPAIWWCSIFVCVFRSDYMLEQAHLCSLAWTGSSICSHAWTGSFFVRMSEQGQFVQLTFFDFVHMPVWLWSHTWTPDSFHFLPEHLFRLFTCHYRRVCVHIHDPCTWRVITVFTRVRYTATGRRACCNRTHLFTDTVTPRHQPDSEDLLFLPRHWHFPGTPTNLPVPNDVPLIQRRRSVGATSSTLPRHCAGAGRSGKRRSYGASTSPPAPHAKSATRPGCGWRQLASRRDADDEPLMARQRADVSGEDPTLRQSTSDWWQLDPLLVLEPLPLPIISADNTRRSPDVGLWTGQSCRRWANDRPIFVQVLSVPSHTPLTHRWNVSSCSGKMGNLQRGTQFFTINQFNISDSIV